MAPRPLKLAVVLGLLALACAAGLVALGLQRAPLQQQLARQRWQQRRPPHYQMEVAWASGWSFGHVLVEVRDGRIVGGRDLDRGQPLDPSRLFAAGYYGSVDNLLDLIDAQLRPSPRWRHQLARYHPLLAHWLDPCAAPLPSASYDATFGYPTAIDYYDSECIETNFNLSKVRITQFRPLP